MYKEENIIKEYSYSNDTGDAQAIVYHLFPGVEVAYTSVHMADFDFGLLEQGERKNYVTHGEEASWETILTLDPEYMFILDRSTATGASDEGVMGAREVIENELIKELDVYKDGKIVYFMEHANVWYTSTGGIQALDTMLADLEGALLH